ncbi:MAG: Crp/Fnr family transcriptional regulator [Bacteroidales bacterium]
MIQLETAQLQRTPIFEGVSAQVIEQFLASSPKTIRSYKNGNIIAMQGDICRSIYMLYCGKVYGSMVNSDGKQIIIDRITGPLLLAPNFLFATDNVFPVTAEVVSNEAIVLIINKDRFIRLMQEQPQILKNFLKVLSDRSNFLAAKINTFALKSLQTRLANYLYDSDSFIDSTKESQQNIADRMGVTRPALNKAIAKLVEQGCIELNKGKISVINKGKLKILL